MTIPKLFLRRLSTVGGGGVEGPLRCSADRTALGESTNEMVSHHHGGAEFKAAVSVRRRRINVPRQERWPWTTQRSRTRTPTGYTRMHTETLPRPTTHRALLALLLHLLPRPPPPARLAPSQRPWQQSCLTSISPSSSSFSSLQTKMTTKTSV